MDLNHVVLAPDPAMATDAERLEPQALADRLRDSWARAFRSPELQAVGRVLDDDGVTVAACVDEARRITDNPTTQKRIDTIRRSVHRAAPDLPAGAFERFVLGHATLHHLDGIERLPVAEAVKRLTYSGLTRFAEPRALLTDQPHRFVALCKIATLRRFPAGQFDWERSGLPRSWLPLVRPASTLARLLRTVVFEWRGFNPAFFVHMAVTHRVIALLERDTLAAYRRMAESMALQPDVKGLIASSWLHSPDTFAVSPHLAWMNDVFLRNGAIVGTMGPAEPSCGVLTRSVERKRAFAEGRFKPTLGLVVWPRREMLAWAERQPGF